MKPARISVHGFRGAAGGLGCGRSARNARPAAKPWLAATGGCSYSANSAAGLVSADGTAGDGGTIGAGTIGMGGTAAAGLVSLTTSARIGDSASRGWFQQLAPIRPHALQRCSAVSLSKAPLSRNRNNCRSIALRSASSLASGLLRSFPHQLHLGPPPGVDAPQKTQG